MEMVINLWFVLGLAIYVIGVLITYGLMDGGTKTDRNTRNEVNAEVMIMFLWPLAAIFVIVYCLGKMIVDFGRFLGQKFLS